MGEDFLNSTQQTVAWLKNTHDAGNLMMKPPFQRNPVWTEPQKSYLIDTILNGFPIPEIYMQQEVDANGREKHIIVDGQQRVRACLEFIEGKFAMNSKDSPRWPDLMFEDLTEAERKQIFAYKFIVRTLPPVSDETLRGIFRRLNRNVVALNAQELRHATYWGPFIKSMEKISDFEWWEQLGLFTPNDVRRMLDVEYVSELAMAFLHGPQNKKTNLEKTYQLYEPAFEEAPRLEQTFVKVLGELAQILPELRGTRWRKKSDFYTLFLVFTTHAQSLPLSAEKRLSARSALLAFGRDVDSAVATPTSSRRRAVRRQVIKYSNSVEKAASDLANRKARAEALQEVLQPVFA
ncbi:MAG TPA: DUF262 domain-containing protein [Verrucomicrobiae bacterium]